ncbi:ly6/PLAUR domain-containing protein 5-like isoform X1 [Carettochelys insculpta]|uniref:ly6/PLAUR domain-containing protein 5-like isoform X1 n=1 Tax=Carettochelys insculpta TaxID=44489 RepID=UPI003EBBFC3F
MGGPGAHTAALLGLLVTALLLPEAISLRCHSHTSILLRDQAGRDLTSIRIHNSTESCTRAQDSCVEAAVTLSAGDTSVTLLQKGCSERQPQEGTEAPAVPSGFLHIQAHVRTCQADECNAKGLGSPSQGTAPVAHGPTQCYAGLSLHSQPRSLARVTCEGASARCYHGNGTLAAGKLAVPIFVWSCQAPSCTVLPSRRFGPVQLSQAGTCCTHSLCNRLEALALAGHSHKQPSSPSAVPGNVPLPPAVTSKEHGEPRHSPGVMTTWVPDTDLHFYDDLPDSDNHTASEDLGLPSPKRDRPRSTSPTMHPTEPSKWNVTRQYTSPSSHKNPHLRPQTSQALGLRLSPLLTVLGIACLGL